jgi:hypothetical protein
VGMVSFDVPCARIDAKGLGRVGHDLSVKKVGAARRPTERLYAHALPGCRVVALFSPATRDEAAATCASFAGRTGRFDFDPTGPCRTVNLLDSRCQNQFTRLESWSMPC